MRVFTRVSLICSSELTLVPRRIAGRPQQQPSHDNRSTMIQPTDPIARQGISGKLTGTEHSSLQSILVTFFALSFYNVIELLVLLFLTFHRRGGLYFWSLLVTGCLGVVPYSLGFLLKFFVGDHDFACVTVLTVGWWVMVTGQSVVLYSRLHLVLQDDRVLRGVLCMIIGTILTLHVPTTILTYGSNAQPVRIEFTNGYDIMERIQLAGFTAQETIISAIYVWETVKLLRLGSNEGYRRIMYQVVSINVAMFLMDVVLLVIECDGFYAVQTALKGMVYSVKLKLEFAVLRQLVDLVNRGRQSPQSLVLNSFQTASNPVARFASGSVEGPGFNHHHHHHHRRSASTAGAVTTTVETRAHGSVPDGGIYSSKEFSTWVENRD